MKSVARLKRISFDDVKAVYQDGEKSKNKIRDNNLKIFYRFLLNSVFFLSNLVCIAGVSDIYKNVH